MLRIYSVILEVLRELKPVVERSVDAGLLDKLDHVRAVLVKNTV